MNLWSVDWGNIGSFIQAGATIISTAIAIIALWRQQKQAERLKVVESELDKANFEHQTRFVKLHEKRAEVIAEVHRQIVVLEIWLHHVVLEAELPDEAFISTDGFAKDFDDKFGQISMNLQKLAAYFNLNRLYLDEELCMKIVQFHDAAISETDPIYGFFHKRFNQISEEESIDIYGGNEENLHEKALEVLEYVSDLRRIVENEFRRLLGIKYNESNLTPSTNDLMWIPEPALIDPITWHTQKKATTNPRKPSKPNRA